MNKKRGKRNGLRARSKNARTPAPRAKRAPPPVTQGIVRPVMHFSAVEEGVPYESALVLVRLKNGVFRFGMVLAGKFAAHDYHSDEFVTFAHPEWITHWMVIYPPAGTEQAASDPPLQTIEEAVMQAGAPDRAEDVYA